MKSEQYRRIYEIFAEAVRYPAEERIAFLERTCPDEQVRQEVTQFLLDAEKAERDGFLNTPCFHNVQAVFDGAGEDSIIGQCVGYYEIRRRIASGGMGIVYEAWHPGLKRRVALKMMRSGGLAGTAQLARFRAEAEAAARLQHPNIVQIHEIGEWAANSVHVQVPYLAMEYVEGGSLDRILAGTPQAPRSAAMLVEIIARAVHHAHERRIIHRDLKPANILLSFSRPSRTDSGSAPDRDRWPNDAVPKITDFGLAKRLEESGHTQSRDVLGTPSYMAPEQALGRSKEVGPAADVYALGAILYEMLTGRPPFKAASPVETLQQVTTLEPVEPRRIQPAVPRDLNTICLKCLEKLPAHRYDSAAALANDLRRFAKGEPIHARPAPISDRMVKWVNRYPAAASLIGALFLGLIGTTAGMAIAWNQRNRALAAEVRSHLDAARLAIQRGAWSEALDRYVDAENKGQPLTPDFRLHKIRAWLATDQLHKANRELDDLGRQTLPPDQAALVNLYRGHLRLGENDAEAEQLIRVALASDQLPPAEAFCARGILAQSSPEALDFFEKALAQDRYHQAAREMAGTVLIVLGRLDDAWTHLVRSEALFPEHRSFQFLLVNVEALRGNRKEAVARLQRVRNKLRENEAAAVLALIESFDSKVLGEAMYTNSQGQNAARFAGLFLKYKPVLSFITPSSTVRDAGETPLRIRMPAYFSRFGSDLGRHLVQTWGFQRQTDESIRDLKRLVDIHPEGSLCYLYAAALLLRAYPPTLHTRPVTETRLSRLSETRSAFLRALDTPSIVPVRALVLDGLIAVELLLSVGDRANPDSAMLAQTVQHVRERLTLGTIRDSGVAAICTITAIEANEIDLARLLLSDWERIAPKEKSIPYRRAQLELRAGAFDAAIKAAKQALTHNPKNEDAQRVLTDAQKRLAESQH